MLHESIWRALDALAAAHNLTPSGLARASGLDPTAFNKSKRATPDGRPRWPSTESVWRALDATSTSFDEFAALLAGRSPGAGRAIPVVSAARAATEGLFDETGYPIGSGETVRFPDLGDARVYALEVAGDAWTPTYRHGDLLIVQPGAALRRGDRIAARWRDDTLSVWELGRRNEQKIELISLCAGLATREAAAGELAWMARILWASQ